ncbi:MAG: SDR family oxidoreductase [Hyphomicrobiales bacterium]
MNRLFCFGMGYTARRLAQRLRAEGWRVTGSCRTRDKAQSLRREDFTPLLLDTDRPIKTLSGHLSGVTHILVSVPPEGVGCPIVRLYGAEIAHYARRIAWVGYLSSTGIYGDHAGKKVDEDTPPVPTTQRGRRRLKAERQWLGLYRNCGLAVHIFRLAGLYGPGRNALERVRAGSARRIVKPGQMFNRIHIDDVVGILKSSIDRPRPGAIYNLCDDEPGPPQDVIAYAARLLGRDPPPDIAFDTAELSPMAASFYAENKHVANSRIKSELGYRLRYRTYREGLVALLDHTDR